MSKSNYTDQPEKVHPLTGWLILAALYSDEEIWAPIPGFPGYEVSSKARIRSFMKLVKIPGLRGSRSIISNTIQKYLKPNPNTRGGHLNYGLRTTNKTSLTKQVGYWMLSAFVRTWPGKGWYCCHNDGNCLNNDLSNIRWDTKNADAIDRVLHGNHPLAYLTVEKVKEIHKLNREDVNTGEIAKMIGTSRSNVYNVIKRVSWKWVTEE